MGRDKALIRFDGATLLERAVNRLRQVCDPIFVAAGSRRIEVAGCTTVEDAAPGSGPLGALAAALHASPHRVTAAVAVDMPWVDAALLRLLLGRIGDHDACVPVSDHGPEPLHAVYSGASVQACEAALASADPSLRGFLARVRVRYVSEDEWRCAGIAPGFARNVNTPADLARLRSSPVR